MRVRRVRAARSLRRGRRITCPRHMSPWVTPLLPLLTPLARPQRGSSGHHTVTYASAGFLGRAGCRRARVRSRFFLFFSCDREHATSRFFRKCGGLRRKVSAVSRLSLSLSLSPSEDGPRPVKSSEVRSLLNKCNKRGKQDTLNGFGRLIIEKFLRFPVEIFAEDFTNF